MNSQRAIFTTGSLTPNQNYIIIIFVFFRALHTVGIPRPARTRNVFRFTYHRGVSPNHRTLLRLAHIFEYRLVIAESLHVRGDVHWART